MKICDDEDLDKNIKLFVILVENKIILIYAPWYREYFGRTCVGHSDV